MANRVTAPRELDYVSKPEEAKTELEAKFEHIRRLSEGKSTVRLSIPQSVAKGSFLLPRGTSVNFGPSGIGRSNSQRVNIRSAIAFFESEIAKESFGASKDHRRHFDLTKYGRKDGRCGNGESPQ